MTKKEFIIIIWGYHKQIYNFPKEQNYHLHPIEIAKGLGYDVKVISLDDLHPPEDDPNFPQDVPIFRFSSFFTYILFLLKHRDAAFYVNSLTLKTLIAWMLVKHSIFIPHDYIFGSHWIKKIIIKFFYQFYTKIRVNNTAEAHEINTIRSNLAEVVPLVIDTKNIILPTQKKHFTLLSLGNLIPKKNPEFLLKALSETKRRGYSFQMTTIWADRLKENWLKENYNELITKYGLNSEVHYLSYLPFDEAYEHILKTTIYVNTSSHEWLCLALYESISAWLWVILPRILSFEWIFWDDVYTYELGNIDALVDTIIQAYDEIDHLPKKILNMQTLVQNRYNYDNITSKLIELFQKTYEK